MAKKQAKLEINLKVLTEGVEKASKGLGTIANEINKFSSFSSKIGKTAKQVETLSNALSKGAKLLQKFGSAGAAGGKNEAVEMAEGLVRALDKIKDTGGFGKNLGKVVKEAGGLGEMLTKVASAAGAGGAGAGAAGGLSALAAAAAPLLPLFIALAAIIAVLAAGFVALKVAVVALKVGIAVAKAIMQAWQSQLQQLKASLTELKQALGRGVDGLRQLTQGLLSVGRAITFFISIPLTAFIKEATEAAIKFEQQMARVQKVLGVSAENVAPLRDFLLDLSQVSSVSIDTLSKFAEQLAQLGVKDLGRMKEMITVFEVFSVSADIASDSIAFSLGKIARAFGQDLNSQQASSFLLGLASTLNILENNAAVTASSLLITMGDIGSEAAMLGIPPYVIASWAALTQEQNMSANEAGTAIKRLITGVIEYSDEVMKVTGATERWGDVVGFQSALNQDFEGTIYGVAEMIANQETSVQSIGAAYEALEKRGGSAIVKLAQSIKEGGEDVNRYKELVQLASEAWTDYTSLLEEFKVMQSTTSASINQIKNSLQVLSVTIGQDVLPAIRDFISFAAPAIKALAETFAGLDTTTKRWVLGIIAFVAIAGPAAFFINQVAFGFVMAAQGIAKMLAVIPAAVKFIALLLKGMLSLNPAALMVGLAIFSVFKAIKTNTEGVIQGIIDVFRNLAGVFKSWGGGLFSAFADGIDAARSRIEESVRGIISIFEAFFKSFSPPKEGPLSKIDVWGKNLFNTYLQGFENADFDVLKNVAGKVEGILTAFNFTPTSEGKDAARKNIVTSMITFREDFAKLLSDFRKFGKVSADAINKLVKGFGNAADEVKELIEITLRYETLLKQIRDIEQAQKEVKDTYKAQEEAISSSAMSAEEMVEQLGEAQWIRDRNLSALEEEKKLLEEQAAAEKEKLEWQNDMMDALQDQADLMMELQEILADMADKMSGALGDIAESLEGLGGDIDFGGSDIEDFMAEMNSRMEDFRKNIDKVKVAGVTTFKLLIGLAKVFWAAIANPAGLPDAFEGLDNLKGDVLDTFGLGDMQGFSEALENGTADQLDIFPIDASKLELWSNVETMFERGGFVEALDGFGYDLGLGIEETFLSIRGDVEPLITEFWDILTGKQETDADDSTINKVAGFLNDAYQGLVDHGPSILSSLTTIAQQIWDFVGSLVGIEDSGPNVESVLSTIDDVFARIAEKETVPKILEAIWIALGIMYNIALAIIAPLVLLYAVMTNLDKPALILAGGFWSVAIAAANAGAAVIGLIQAFPGLFGLDRALEGPKTLLEGIAAAAEENMGIIARELLNIETAMPEDLSVDIELPTYPFEAFEEAARNASTGLSTSVTDIVDTGDKLASGLGEHLVSANGHIESFATEANLKLDEVTGTTNEVMTGFTQITEVGQTMAQIMGGIVVPAPLFEDAIPPNWLSWGPPGWASSGGSGGSSSSAGETYGGGKDYGPGLQAGGFHSGPGPAWVGEGGRELMSIPPGGHITSHGLSSLIMGNLNSSTPSGGDTILNINNPVIREDKDIDKLTDKVAAKLAKRTRGRGRFGGA